jgi:hypothetical protein
VADDAVAPQPWLGLIDHLSHAVCSPEAREGSG